MAPTVSSHINFHNFDMKSLKSDLSDPASNKCSKEELDAESEQQKCDILTDIQTFRDHLELTDRLKKTLYYGKLPSTECPSLSLTGVTIEMFSKTVPKGGLQVLDMYHAATISRKACISPCSMILAMVYLEQLRHKNPEYLQNVSSCDLFLVSMMVASKYLYDDGEDDEVFNSEWATSANMELKDLNCMEREFLAAMDWEIFIRPNLFFDVLCQVEAKIAYSEFSKRGWLTYTDLTVLSERPVFIQHWLLLLNSVAQVITVSAVAYVAAALTLLGTVPMIQHCYTPVRDILQTTMQTSIVSRQPLTSDMHDDILIEMSKISADLLPENYLDIYVSNVPDEVHHLEAMHHMDYSLKLADFTDNSSRLCKLCQNPLIANAFICSPCHRDKICGKLSLLKTNFGINSFKCKTKNMKNDHQYYEKDLGITKPLNMWLTGWSTLMPSKNCIEMAFKA